MEEKISPMERRTLAALDSANPFQTPIRQHSSLDGRPVARVQPPQDTQMSKESPKQKKQKPDSIEAILARVEAEESPKISPETAENPQKTAQDPIKEPVLQEIEAPEIVVTHDSGGCPSYRTEFAGRDIFVGLPWYKTSNPVTTMALVAMALDFGKDQIRFDLVFGDAMVYHSRNTIAQKFLETDAKWLFMLDDDIIPAIGRAAWYKAWVASARTALDMPLQRHVLHRLIGAGKTLVGGAYFGRQEGGKLMCSNQSLESDARAFSDKVVPVDWVGTGAMLIHRRVFDDMRKSFPDLAPSAPGMPFDYFKPGSNGAGEDIEFCRRAKSCGHHPHIDLGIPLAHVGYKAY